MGGGGVCMSHVNLRNAHVLCGYFSNFHIDFKMVPQGGLRGGGEVLFFEGGGDSQTS